MRRNPAGSSRRGPCSWRGGRACPRRRARGVGAADACREEGEEEEEEEVHARTEASTAGGHAARARLTFCPVRSHVGEVAGREGERPRGRDGVAGERQDAPSREVSKEEGKAVEDSVFASSKERKKEENPARILGVRATVRNVGGARWWCGVRAEDEG